MKEKKSPHRTRTMLALTHTKTSKELLNHMRTKQIHISQTEKMNSIFVSRQFEAHSYESLDPLIEILPNTRKDVEKKSADTSTSRTVSIGKQVIKILSAIDQNQLHTDERERARSAESGEGSSKASIAPHFSVSPRRSRKNTLHTESTQYAHGKMRN